MLQERSGLLSKRTERVEWMYSGSSEAVGNITEELLLGRRRLDKIPHAEPTDSHVSSTHRGHTEQTIPSMRDLEARVREDPLFPIKQQERSLVRERGRPTLKLHGDLPAGRRYFQNAKSSVATESSRHRSRSPSRSRARVRGRGGTSLDNDRALL